MGNKHTNGIVGNDDTASTSENALKGRHESLHRVFGRFSQRKPTPLKEITASNTTEEFSSAISPTNQEKFCDRHQQQSQQRPEPPKRRKRRYLCRRRSETEDEGNATEDEQQKKNVGQINTTTNTRQKRPAPKPPQQSPLNTQKDEEKPKIQEKIIQVQPRKNNKEIKPETTENTDHREFIESLFATDVSNAVTELDRKSSIKSNREVDKPALEDDDGDVQNEISKQNRKNNNDETVAEATAKTPTATMPAIIPVPFGSNNNSSLLEPIEATLNAVSNETLLSRPEQHVPSTLKIAIAGLEDDDDDADEFYSHRSNYDSPESERDCGIVILREVSISSDSLFTESSDSKRTTSLTSDIDENEADAGNQENENTSSERLITAKSHKQEHQQHQQQPIKEPRKIITTPNRKSKPKTPRPVSDISVASGDTSGILSPTIAQAISDLQKRNCIDKLAQLSLSRTEIFEIPPSATTNDTSSPDLDAESSDEQMALQLGKKLAQMLHSNNNNNLIGDEVVTMNTNTNINSSSNNGNIAAASSNLNKTATTSSTTTPTAVAATTAITELANNGNNRDAGGGICNGSSPAAAAAAATMTTMNTNELFNIAKAKKIELQNLSSRLAASSTTTPTQQQQINIQAVEGTASTDVSKQNLLTQTNVGNSTTTGEKQSTVIISFKSSQTPVQAQQQQQQQQQQKTLSEVTSSPTTNIITTLSHTSGTAAATATTTTTPHHQPSATTADIASSAIVGTPKCNVLKKVASFTLEKASPTTAAAALAAGDANDAAALVATSGNTVASHVEKNIGVSGNGNGNGYSNIVGRRLSYVPEKLSFDAYEKFEGQMLLKWLVSSLQTEVANDGSNNIKLNNLSEHEIQALIMQCCSNLIQVGVLKQISENITEVFSPFEMYQWTRSAVQFGMQPPPTPGKLDKTHGVWPYCSTPQSTRKTLKAVQADVQPSTGTPITTTATSEILKKRLLNCNNIAEVHTVIDEMLPNIETQRRPSTRCQQIAEIFDSSETTIYEFNKKFENTKQEERKAQTRNAATQHEAGNDLCCQCSNKLKKTEILKTFEEIGIQTELNEIEEKIKSNLVISPIPPPPPPPLPPPPILMQNPKSNAIPVPPPPPPPVMKPTSNSGLVPPAAEKERTSTSPIPPPPPPPLLQNMNKTNVPALQSTPPSRSPSNTSTNVPSPLPALPSDSSFFIAKNTLRKIAVNPPKPMRPLYWTRIIAPPKPPAPPTPPIETPTESTDSSNSSPEDAPINAITNFPPVAPKEIWQEIDETKIDNLDEFTELFSRQAVAPPVKTIKPKPERVRTVKVLDAKRSQNVGIVARTLHVDFCEIEHAIYNLDSSVVSLETLQHIVHMKATDQELEQIKEAAKDDLPLDLPEQFLLKLSQISMSNERISCIVFQMEFEDAATIVTRKLEVIFSVSKFLIESNDLKKLFSIILTLGNYMNGGNVQRGQADGFTLEILNKLKDVKSQQSQITLLHFIVRTYINHRRKEGLQLLEIPFPIPEPSEIERAMQVDFTETNRQINELSNKLNACRKTTEEVLLASTPETVEPFKTKMESVMNDAMKTVDKLTKELASCREIFIDAMRFYQFKPKTGTVETCTPAQFFEYWTHFTNDFRDIWKREIAMICDALLKKSKQLEKEARKNVKTTKAKPGGLKDRMLRLRNLDQKK